MVKTFQLQTEEEMLSLASTLAKQVKDGAVIFLHGPLGAGKTTFARGFLRALQYKGKVKSPTFTLVEPYEINGRSVFHFDFYRLDDPRALLEIGIHDYFTPSSICLIEWAEKGVPLLPLQDVDCEIAFSGEGRMVKMEACTERGKGILRGVEP